MFILNFNLLLRDPKASFTSEELAMAAACNGNNKHIVNKFNSNTYCVHLYCLLYFKQRVQKKAGIC